MLVGVISDTHDNVEAVEAAVSVFESEGVDTLVHSGDVIAPPVVPFFEGFEVHAVLGNNDGERAGLDAAFSDLGRGSKLHGRFAVLELGGRRFAVLHGEDLAEVDAYADTGAFDYVLYGHHHEAQARKVGETTVVNPGAHFPTVPDGERSVAIIDTETDEVRFVNVA